MYEGRVPLSHGGAGGFNGGRSTHSIGDIVVPPAPGLGPGGGGPSSQGGFATRGFGPQGGHIYGNQELIPLIGGSGGGGGVGRDGQGGGGGGGAILIASSTSIEIWGIINVRGGAGAGDPAVRYKNLGGGSGGAIRLIANSITITQSARLHASGGATNSLYFGDVSHLGIGRIRLEGFVSLPSGPRFDGTYSQSAPGPITRPLRATLNIVSIGGVPVRNPRGDLSIPDVTLSSTVRQPVPIVVAASGIPPGMQLDVNISSNFGGGNAEVVENPPLEGTLESSSTTIMANFPTTTNSVIYVSATFNIPENMAILTIGCERVAKMRVKAGLGGEPEVTYITRSGREVRVSEAKKLER